MHKKIVLLVVLCFLFTISCSSPSNPDNGNEGNNGGSTVPPPTGPTEEELIKKYGIDIGQEDTVISQKIEENLKAYYTEMGSYRVIFTGTPKDYTQSANESILILTVKAAINIGTAKNINMDIKNIDFKDNTIKTGMFSGESIDDTIIINLIFPENKIKTIGEMSFANLYNVKEIVIPDSVIEIEGNAFQYSQSIEVLNLGNGVQTIGDQAFIGLEYLKELVIPNSVTSIGMGAFAQSQFVTKITIPASLTSVGNMAFVSCPSLTTVIYYGTSPSTINNNDALLECLSLTTLILPNVNSPQLNDWKTFLGGNFTEVKQN
ncbi:leucine-rich repeat domain-containing protein [Brachyspira pilosicoli]|uniref:leucine-rich repeat domain-containing protein n=1 Tax=Brachyspira pilosicoli TaxID=52584 RepID=UPI001C66DEFE|nr:leucine-rich repeat domain-containing protein [Brachyspira pilosicoli]MBW5391740.1 leucine-rich repeat domain-containing protein [Brachyspira pilosicoli]